MTANFTCKPEVFQSITSSSPCHPVVGEIYQASLSAQKRLAGLLKTTPPIESHFFSNASGARVYLKPENLQETGSFKVRGAYNKIASLSLAQRSKGVVAASAGNHSQGVALAAKQLGVSAVIVMPKTTPLIKVEATKSHGAEVVLHGDTYDEAAAHAEHLREQTQRTFVHPFDDLEVIAGQGTIGLELLEALPDLDLILVPIGGGGLVAGIAACVKALNPRIKVYGVEPEGAATMKSALNAQSLVSLSALRTIADGVAVKRAGELTFAVSQAVLDGVITVSDQEIMEAFCLLLEKHKLIGETSGVLSVAALNHLNQLDLRPQIKAVDSLQQPSVSPLKVACIISGGNIDLVTASAMINRGLVTRGRLFCFSVELPDKPGELAAIARILSETNANVIKLDHNQFKSLDRFRNAVLEVTCETNGHAHVAQIEAAMAAGGYRIRQVF